MMRMVIGCIHILMLAALAHRLWKRETTSLRIYFWPGLIVKIMAGVLLGVLYIYYYEAGDTFQYFQDGSKLAALGHDDVRLYFSFLWSGDGSFDVWKAIGFTAPRALFLVKIVSVLCILTANNYWIVSLYFSVASFYGAWILVKQIVVLTPSSKYAAITAFLFFPSVVFWSSGLIKESLAMASLFFICALLLKAWRRENPTWFEWIFSFVALWLLWNLKYYYLAVFLPVATTALMLRLVVFPMVKTNNIVIQIAIWFVVFIAPLVVVTFIHPNFYPEQFLTVIVSNYQAFIQQSDPGDVIRYADLQPTALSILKNSPWALFSGLFRPFVWEANTTFQFLVAVENTVVFLFTVAAILRCKTLFQSASRLLVFSIVIYSTVLCIFLALSTPNFGTLVRYKVGFLPFFILIILIDNSFLSRIFSFYERSISSLVR